MLYQLHRRSNEGSKWMTAALIGIYIAIAALLFLVNKPDDTNNKEKNYNSSYSKKSSGATFSDTQSGVY